MAKNKKRKLYKLLPVFRSRIVWVEVNKPKIVRLSSFLEKVYAIAN